jgi:hypothetical protein
MMKNTLTNTFILFLIVFCQVLSQDPPPLPSAPNQGPISGTIFLLIGGIFIVARNYFKNGK